jgi:hypothetical protein
MNRLFSFVFLLICFVIWSKAERVYVNDKLVRLKPLTDEHLNYLRALEDGGSVDFWTDIITPNRPVDVHLRENEFDQYVSEFKQYSLPYEVVIDDLQKVIDDEQQQLAQDRLMRQVQSRLLGETKADIVGTYVSYNEMVQFLEDQSTADPTFIKVEDVGRTFQGRTIKTIAIKFNPSSTRNIWIDCGIHARGKKRKLLQHISFVFFIFLPIIRMDYTN